MADLCDSKPFNWSLKVPDDSKFMFVKNNITDVFKKYNLKISDIFNECYKSQLRNAFSHSQYHFGINGHKIVLENYDDKYNKIKHINFDEWTTIFLKSTMLQNSFHNKFNNEIKKLDDGKEYEVNMHHGSLKNKGILIYNKEYDRFSRRIK